MMELADMRDLGSRAERRAGSTPVTRTSVAADDISFAATIFLTELSSLLTHYVAAPFKPGPTSLGSGFVFFTAKSALLRRFLFHGE